MSSITSEADSHRVRALARHFKRQGETNLRRVLIVGTQQQARSYIGALTASLKSVTVVGYLHGDSSGVSLNGARIDPRFQTLEELIDTILVDEVVVTGLDAPFNYEELAVACATRGIVFRKIVPMPAFSRPRYSAIPLRPGECLVSLETVPGHRPLLALKRAIDICLSIPGLLAFMIIYALCWRRIARETGGSVIFKQKRVGRNGRVFTLYKFRTMYADAESRLAELRGNNEMNGHVFKIKNDPRITPLGHFLRRHHLDEVPQFWNVLRGDMSVVGTRPPTCAEVASYLPHHRRRLSMKPGLTGIWQLRGNEQVKDFEEIVRLDCGYIDNWSLSLDSRIILKTAAMLILGNGW